MTFAFKTFELKQRMVEICVSGPEYSVKENSQNVELNYQQMEILKQQIKNTQKLDPEDLTRE